MNKLIERVGNPRALVYIDEVCLWVYPTNQQAWQHLSELSKTADDLDQSWPEDVYVAFMIEEIGDMISVPQIDKVVKEGEKLTYKGLFGSDFDEFRQRIIDSWPTIKEGLSDR
ncbi:hypothetical protein KAR91_79675 [Candidatus Pacearchaeota archaeon]|nr:hypothetical protein [Candidatus Pacearchaeota archaeon]